MSAITTTSNQALLSHNNAIQANAKPSLGCKETLFSFLCCCFENKEDAVKAGFNSNNSKVSIATESKSINGGQNYFNATSAPVKIILPNQQKNTLIQSNLEEKLDSKEHDDIQSRCKELTEIDKQNAKEHCSNFIEKYNKLKTVLSASVKKVKVSSLQKVNKKNCYDTINYSIKKLIDLKILKASVADEDLALKSIKIIAILDILDSTMVNSFSFHNNQQARSIDTLSDLFSSIQEDDDDIFQDKDQKKEPLVLKRSFTPDGRKSSTQK